MKLTPIAANQNEVEFTNGTQVFFSYKTPVAAYCPSRGYIKTAKYWSVTTSRHINKWLKGITEVTEVPQEMLTALVGKSSQFFFIIHSTLFKQNETKIYEKNLYSKKKSIKKTLTLDMLRS